MRNGHTERADAIVVGAGLGGLTAAAYLARAGRSVLVLERAGHAGGRAITNDRDGFLFNIGPHALYRKGRGPAVLRELGVRFDGGMPPLAGLLWKDGAFEKLPATPAATLKTRLLDARGKLEFGRFFATLPLTDPARHRDVTFNEWLARNARREPVREIARAILRVASYANAPDVMSAEVALHQMKLSLGGVYYLDGGWQTLVDGLRAAAEAAGARVVTKAPVASVEVERGAVRGVRLDDGATIGADAVVVAVEPQHAARIVGGEAGALIARWTEEAVPVRLATLDVGLRRLPRPEARFVLGVDRPVYLSSHGDIARLTPEGGALIHVSKYLAPDDQTTARERETELEDLLDAAQPGWRDELVQRQFLPDMTVVGGAPTPAQGGFGGRPPVEAPGASGLFLAGDWVGEEGWLADASFASGKRAGELASRLVAAGGLVAAAR